MIGGLLLGLLIGLAVGALAVLALLRAVGRLTGAVRPRAVLEVVLDGLSSRPRRDGMAAQRLLARRLRHTGSRTASGGTVAATRLDLHVSPEDYGLIEASMGLPDAERDLAAFYADHARQQGWTLSRSPEVVLVRDISLRPRQAFARPTTTTGALRTVADAVTDVIPPLPGDASVTAVLPDLSDLLDPSGPSAGGDLVIVHGTDVRTIPAAQGTASIGRGSHNDLVIDRPGVARDHVVLDHRDDGWWIVPGSAPKGTLLDGRPLEDPARIDGQADLMLGRGVRLRLTG